MKFVIFVVISVLQCIFNLTLEEAKMRACLLLSRERLKQDKETMEIIIKEAPDEQQRETAINTIKSITLLHCLENISVDHTISLLKEKYRVNSLTERNKFLLNYENWPSLLNSKEPQHLSFIISSLSEKITEMHKRNVFSIELNDEDFNQLNIKNNMNVENRFKKDQNEEKNNPKDDDLHNLNTRSIWEELINQYNDIDSHTKSMINLMIIGLCIFLTSRVFKLILRTCKKTISHKPLNKKGW